MKQSAIFVLAMGAGISLGQAALVYHESVQGDFSDNYLTPTPVVLGAGDNVLTGSLRGGGLDKDLFTLTIPNALALSAIRVTAFVGGFNGSFMGAQPGSVLSHSPADYILDGQGQPVTVGPINYVLIGELDAAENRDVMPQLVVGAPMGGQSPLPAGDYAFWLNETGAGSTYTLTFEVVPEPGAVLLVSLGLACSLGRRTRG